MATNANFKVKNGLDVSGTATATSFVGPITGNASTATTLANGRTFSITGDGTGTSGSFNGSADASLALTLASVGTAGTYKSVTTDAKGRITAGTNPTTLAGYGITDALPNNADATYTGSLTLTGSIIPATDVTYDLGTAAKQFRHIWVGPGSLYVNGKQVITDTSGTITVSTTVDQNLRLETSGVGDLQLNAAGTGTIQVKAPMTITTGKKVLDSAGIQVEFGDNIEMGGNKITGLAAPSAGGDAANKTYVDGATTSDTTIVRTTGAQTIGGAKTFTGNMVVSGDLTISGTTTTVNTANLSIADNIIVLNSDFTTGTPTESSGFQVQRGDAGVVKFLWDEDNDRFTMLDGAGTPNYLSLYTTATITAGTFVGALTGNASTATKLATARTINGASFDGSANTSFTTDAVNEGSTNLYYTNARASAAAPIQTVFGRTGTISLMDTDVITALTYTPQAVDADLTAIAALSGTAGFLKKTAANTWALDTTAYLSGSVGTAGAKGSASSVPVFTTDAQGRVTANTDTPIAIAGSQISSGTVGTARLGSGTADSTTFLRGDGSWAVADAGTAAAGTLTGTTLATNVVTSSLTTIGTLTSLVTSGSVGIGGTAIGALDVIGASTTEVRIRSSAVANARLLLQNSSSGTTGSDGFAVVCSSPDAYLWNYENGLMIFGTNNTERMRIDSSGNVGIGGTPNVIGAGYTVLTINNTTAGVLDFNVSGTRTGTLFAGSSEYRLNALTSIPLTFFTNNTERMRIDATGNVSIGTSSAGAKLHVESGDFWVRNGTINIGPGAAGNIQAQLSTVQADSNNGSLILSTRGGGTLTERMRIDASGNVGIGVTPSNKLHVYSTSARPLTIGNASSTWSFGSSSTNFAIRENAASTDFLTIDSSGNVGIGTIPATKLHLKNNSTTLSNNNFITLSNKGTNTTDNTNTYAIGGILFDAYRDVRDPSNVAGIWAERSPASAGLASQGALVFGTAGGGGNITQDASLPAERMRIDASGNVGIGTAPTYKLDVPFAVRLNSIERTAAGQLYINASDVAGYVTINTAGAERMRIDQFGTACIGQTSDQVGSLAHRAVINFPGGGTRYGLGFRAVADSTNAITFANAANSVVGSVTQSGSATAYNTTSDARLKENIVDAPEASDLVNAMQVRSFNFKGVEGSEVQHGFIAQELQTVAPIAVCVGDDGEEITSAWGVDYSKLVPILVKSLQEALQRIDALEARLSK